jgi:aspartyl-tRNA(Asn)/glutamyl-tRNA(Gln) amidotransferase subunit A
MPFSSYREIRDGIRTGTHTCVSVVKSYLQEIDRKAHLNAFLETYPEEALEKAAEVDRKIKAGIAGRLAGMVIGVKDNICHKDHPVSAASKILNPFISLYSATAIERLLNEDAIIVGRLNCDEFAMGGSNENSAYGPTLNPIDTEKVPGGSSGGSAAAVAAGLCTVALGSDTGGSVRQPAAFCGVAGLKPTYGRVSRYGLIAYASSFDQIGPLAKSVEDIALTMEIIAGHDGKDATASTRTVPSYSQHVNEIPNPSRIAVIAECIDNEGLDGEIRAKMLSVIDDLKSKGHSVESVSFPFLKYMVPAYYVLTTAEASSNLSRFGGILYGHQSKDAKNIDAVIKKSRSEGFGKEVKRRIMLGTFVLSAGYYDAYYAKAQKVRRILKDKTAEILRNADFIVMPSTPRTAFGLGEISDPVTMYLEDIFTVQANLTGYPAISVPCGTHSGGLPIGIQVIANDFQEESLLQFANSIMQSA